MNRAERRRTEREARKLQKRLNKSLGTGSSDGPLVKDHSFQQTLEEEVARLGIQPSESERLLWHLNGYFPKQSVPVNEITHQEAGRILSTTLRLMQQSQNPHLRQATDFLKPLVDSRVVRFQIPPRLLTRTSAAINMATSTTIENGKVVWNISVPADNILNRDSVSVALSIAHEAEHVRSSMVYIQSLPTSLSLEEKVKRDNARRQIASERIAEEARGEGKEALAFIHQYTLGYRPGNRFDIEAAAIFIRSNKDPSHPGWKNYVASEILRIR